MVPPLSSLSHHVADLSCSPCLSLKQRIAEGIGHASHFLTAALGTQIALSGSPSAYHGVHGDHKQEGKLGAVASEHAICTNIGIDLLKAGGNAADALVGTVFCVGTIGMYHSGIGGGGYVKICSTISNQYKRNLMVCLSWMLIWRIDCDILANCRVLADSCLSEARTVHTNI